MKKIQGHRIPFFASCRVLGLTVHNGLRIEGVSLPNVFKRCAPVKP
jgi:hypothetical protein